MNEFRIDQKYVWDYYNVATTTNGGTDGMYLWDDMSYAHTRHRGSIHSFYFYNVLNKIAKIKTFIDEF